jgi:RNA polymerase sigma-70 factor (ECF subfamily)
MLPAPALARSGPGHRPELDRAGAEFAQLRPRLMRIAIRILGRWSDAEDIVQDTWLRWQTCDRSAVQNSTAFLVTTATRLAINASQTARVRRESHVGHWSPEPVDKGKDHAAGVEQSAALELGILLLVQQLSTTERAAYILRHAFDYPYPRIAELLHLTEANARQIVSRAGKHLTTERRRPAPGAGAEPRRLMHAFVAAAQRGDVAALELVLAPNATTAAGGDGVAA